MRSRREGRTNRFTTSTIATASSTNSRRSAMAVASPMVSEAIMSANELENTACCQLPGVQA